MRLRRRERGDDVLRLRDVELDGEDAVGGVLGDQVREDLGAARGRDYGVAFLEGDLGEDAAEAVG